MNNKPVAYKAWHEDLGWTYHDWKDGFTAEGVIPLYTHPANPYQSITDTNIEPTVVSYTHPVKELTDEEILELTKDSTIFEYREFDDDMVRFARAILRKAQEK